MVKNSKLSIRAKFTILAILICVIPLSIVSYISVASSVSALENLLAEELKNKTALVGKEIDAFFDQRIADMRVVSQSNTLESPDRDQIRQYLDEVIEANPTISDYVVLKTSGQILAAAGDQSRLGKALQNTAVLELFRATLKSGQGDVYLSDVVEGSSSNSVFLMTPITDDTNTIVEGVLLGEVPMKPVEGIIAEFDDSVIGDKSVYLLNDDSQVIVTSDTQQKLFDTFNDLSG